MRKSLTYKVLAAIMAAGSLGLYAATPAAAADDYTVNNDGETLNDEYNNIYGNGYSFTITGGKIFNVYGAGNGNKDYDKDASGGNVTINGNAEVTSVVCGGRSDGISAHHNTVNIGGGSVTGNVFGGTSESGQAHHNIVNISGGSVTRVVYGGRSADKSAYHNIVNISGGSVGDVRGGYSYHFSACNNIVNINGGTVADDVRGGYSDTGEAYDNTVNISGGSVSGDVYGGYVAQGIANNNEIIVSGSANITNANLYGRNDKASGTGNTLTIDGWSGIAKSIYYFENIEFKNTTFTNGTVLN